MRVVSETSDDSIFAPAAPVPVQMGVNKVTSIYLNIYF